MSEPENLLHADPQNQGTHYEAWNVGVLGPVALSGLNEGKRDLSNQKWTYQVIALHLFIVIRLLSSLLRSAPSMTLMVSPSADRPERRVAGHTLRRRDLVRRVGQRAREAATDMAQGECFKLVGGGQPFHYWQITEGCSWNCC
jgi:hypothetical protein